MKIRILAMALAIFAFFIFVGGPFNQAAKAVAVVDDAVVAILIAALAACGITLAATGGYSNLKEYVSELFNEFCQSNGKAPSEVLRGCQSGTNRFGQVLINNRFVLVIDTFLKWVQLKFSLVNNDTKEIVVPGATLADLQLYGLPLYIDSTSASVNDREFVLVSSSAPVYALLYFQSDVRYFNVSVISHEAATVQIIQIKSNGTIASSTNNDLVYNNNYGLYYFDRSLVAGYFDLTPYAVYSHETAHGALVGNGDIDVNNIGVTAVTGSITAPTDNPDYTDGDGAILDVNGDWGITYDDVVTSVIPDEYEDTSMTFEDEETVQEQVEETQAQSVSSNANDYAVLGLTSVFPFCIPFDIYNLLNCLAADPVAPVVNWRFYVPGIVDQVIVIDLSEFDTVAQILRTLELLAFIVGLAYVTREKFIRS